MICVFMCMVKAFFFLCLNLIEHIISISIVFGLTPQAYGDNSKDYGVNSASLGDKRVISKRIFNLKGYNCLVCRSL